MGHRQKSEANTRLTVTERSSLESKVDSLVNRHRAALACPLSPEALVDLWRANMNHTDMVFWEAAQAKLSVDGNFPLVTPSSQGVLLEFDFAKLLLQIPDTTFRASKLPFWDRRKDMTFVDPRSVLSSAVYKEFREWAMHAVHIHTRTGLTKETLKKIIAISSTVGQLNRMAPELVKYTDMMSQQALSRQERRSPLPDEWMKIERTIVRSSLDHLTFCYLLPAVDDDVQMGNTPWVWDGPGTFSATYMTQPKRELYAELCTYKLPFDPNPMEFGTFVRAKPE